MIDKPSKSHHVGTESGQLPPVSIDPRSAHREPPQPLTLPEFPDAGSTTGKFKVISEGEDRARFHDDSATASAGV